jgi:hypothetical protein
VAPAANRLRLVTAQQLRARVDDTMAEIGHDVGAVVPLQVRLDEARMIRLMVRTACLEPWRPPRPVAAREAGP